MKKIFSPILAICIIIAAIMPFSIKMNQASAATYAENLRSQGFPESYISSLTDLHSKYPNWIFKPLVTNLDWSTAVQGERSKHSNQLIEKSATSDTSMFCKCSSCYKNGSYVVQEASDWVSASQKAVEYYMDPRNFLDEKHIFQFESTSYDGTQTKAGVEAILSGTWMHDSLITYRTTSQSVKLYDSSTKYSDAIMAAAKNSGMSAYYLAAKIRQENGGSTASATAVNGQTAPFQGIYNYFNIGAYTGAMDGLAWAAGFLRTNKATTLYSEYDSSTKTAGGETTALKSSQYMTWRSNAGSYYKVRLYTLSGGKYTEGTTGYVAKSDCRTTYIGDTSSGYGRPWSNPYKAIYYGAKYISNSFKTQNSGYLQKFNVSPSSSSKYSNEYMKNVQAAASESVSSYNGYKNAGILGITKTFYIPVYKNMPNDVSATSITVNDATTSSVTLSWAAVSGAQGYHVQICDEGGDWRDYTYTADTSITISNLESAKRYGVRVRGYYTDSAGAVNYGNFVTRNIATKPGKVEGLSAGTSGANVKLSWKKISGASGYRIYQNNSSSKKYVYKKSVYGASSTSATISGLKSNTTYKFKVAAYKSADNAKFVGAQSSAVSIKTKKNAVNLKSAKSSKKKKITVKWSKISGVSGYQVMWSTSSNFKTNFLSTKVGGASKTSKTLTTAKSKKTYYVRVRAYKKSGKKYTYYSWSKTIKVKVK